MNDTFQKLTKSTKSICGGIDIQMETVAKQDDTDAAGLLLLKVEKEFERFLQFL